MAVFHFPTPAERGSSILVLQASLTATTVTTGGATKAKPHVKPNAERLDTPQDITTSSTPSLGAISHQGRATTETPSMVGPPGTPPRWRVHQDPASTMSGNPSQMASMYGYGCTFLHNTHTLYPIASRMMFLRACRANVGFLVLE